MNLLAPYLLYLKLGFAALIVFGIYHFGTSHQKTKDDAVAAQLRIETQQAILDSQKANEALKQRLEKNHAEAVNALNIAMSVPIPVLRLPKVACPGQEQSTPGSVPAYRYSDLLSGQIEQVLSDGRSRTRETVAACQVDLNSCNVVRSWAAQQ